MSSLRIILLLLLAVLASHVFNMVGWTKTNIPLYHDFVGLFFFLFYLLKYRKIQKQRDIFEKLIKFLWIWPLITLLVKQIFTNEPISIEMQALITMTFAVTSYYFMSYYKISEKLVLLIVIIIAITTFSIQIIQQYIAPYPMFGIDSEGELGAVRNNLYRYSLPTFCFVSFALFYYYERLNRKFSLLNLMLLGIMAASLYFSLTRQLMISALVTIALSYISVNSSKMKRNIGIVLCIAFFFLYQYFDVLFGDLVNLSRTDTYSTDIRQEAIPFILEKSFDNPLQFIFGHGHPQVIYDWGEKDGIWTVDVGIIGELYSYGIVWVIVYFVTTYKILFTYRKKIPLYIRLFVIDCIVHSLMIGPYNNPIKCIAWVFMLYICSLYLDKDKSNSVLQF